MKVDRTLTLHGVLDHHELERREFFQPFLFSEIPSIFLICIFFSSYPISGKNRGRGHTLFGKMIKTIDNPRTTTGRV